MEDLMVWESFTTSIIKAIMKECSFKMSQAFMEFLSAKMELFTKAKFNMEEQTVLDNMKAME